MKARTGAVVRSLDRQAGLRVPEGSLVSCWRWHRGLQLDPQPWFGVQGKPLILNGLGVWIWSTFGNASLLEVTVL